MKRKQEIWREVSLDIHFWFDGWLALGTHFKSVTEKV
jgi:hypothetical protein